MNERKTEIEKKTNLKRQIEMDEEETKDRDRE